MAVWQPIDFHGIVTLDKSIVKDLRAYLEQREAQLALVVSSAIQPSDGDVALPILSPGAHGPDTLEQGIEFLKKSMHSGASSQQIQYTAEDWKGAASLLNRALWDYVELLEGMVAEFFQQLDQIGFESWDKDLIRVVDEIKQLLKQKINATVRGVESLEKELLFFRRLCEIPSGAIGRLRRFFHFRLLDKNLLRNLTKTDKFLGFRYQTFMHRIEQFNLLKDSTEQSIKKFDGYHVFHQFEQGQRKILVSLYQWMRIWELNQTTKSLPDREPVRAIRALQAPEKNLRLFKDYEKALRETLFTRSRLIKHQPLSFLDLVSKIHHQHALQGQVAELHTLGAIVRKYRDFLLSTDPNPYIRSRLGFGETIVGPEPAFSKSLMDLIFDIESLDELYKKMMLSVEQYEEVPPAAFDKAKGNIERILHEMAQPLASYSLMLSKAKLFVQELDRINELGSTRPDVVDFVGDAFSRALRCDWKFHVFYEIPQFQQLFTIHQGIVGALEDRGHLNRMRHFKKQIRHIEDWIKNNNASRHLDEIDVELSDLKGYLQDFLAHVQRIDQDAQEGGAVDPQRLSDLSNQLLEYRCLFGRFFHLLRRDKGEERVIRNQFLFVDQYFETVENKLFKLRGCSQGSIG